MQYRTQLEVPNFAALYPWDSRGARDTFYDAIEAVGWHTVVGGKQGVVGAAGRPTTGRLWVHLEVDDLYDLAVAVRGLEDDLNSMFTPGLVELERPQLTPKKYRI